MSFVFGASLVVRSWTLPRDVFDNLGAGRCEGRADATLSSGPKGQDGVESCIHNSRLLLGFWSPGREH